MDATGSSSKSPAKRAREGQLVAIQISHTGVVVDYSVTPFDDNKFTSNVLDYLDMSFPSDRERLYGFNKYGELDKFLWTSIQAVHHLTDVARIVVMYYDE